MLPALGARLSAVALLLVGVVRAGSEGASPSAHAADDAARQGDPASTAQRRASMLARISDARQRHSSGGGGCGCEPDTDVRFTTRAPPVQHWCAHRYGRDALPDKDHKTANAWQSYETNGKDSSFEYYEVHQIVVDQAGTSYNDALRLENFGIVDEQGDRFDHFIVYWKDKFWDPREWSSTKGTRLFDKGGGSAGFVPAVADGQPLHLTLIPAQSDGNVWGKKAYSVFISKRTKPAGDSNGDLRINIKGCGSAYDPASWSSVTDQPDVFAPPQWNVGTHPYDCSKAEASWWYDLGYYSTLYRLGDDKWKGYSRVEVYFWDGVDLEAPVSTSYVELKVRAKRNGDAHLLCQFLKEGGGLAGLSTLNNYKGGLDLARLRRLSVEVFHGGLYTRELPTTMRIAVHGYGRLSQYALAREYGENPHWDMGTLGGVLLSSEFAILSGAVELSSRCLSTSGANDPCIDVYDIQNGYSARRGLGPVQLNSAYKPMKNADNNYAVRVFDYKQCGSWLTASDGPEVMGQGSLLMYMTILTADDSIKMAVSGIAFQHITLFQGNAGGAANIGSYGKTREAPGETTGMSVDGLYAHRVLQKDASFDGLGGLIVTRNGCYGSKVTNSWIKNVYVPSLGGVFQNGNGGRLGPNVMYRLFSLGFCCDPKQCPFAAEKPQPEQFYEKIYFKSWNNYLNPVDDSEFYSLGVDQKSVKGYIKPIDMFDTSRPNDPGLYVKTYSGQIKDNNKFWYAVDAFPPVNGQPSPDCRKRGVNSCYFTGCTIQAACNTRFEGITAGAVVVNFPTQ